MVPKLSQNCPKMVPNRSQMVSKLSQNCPKEVRARPGAQQKNENDPGGGQGSQSVKKLQFLTLFEGLSGEQVALGCQSVKNCPNIVPFWYQIGFKIVSKWSQNCPKEVRARPGAQQKKTKQRKRPWRRPRGPQCQKPRVFDTF